MSQQFQFQTSRACSEGCGGCCVEVATNLAATSGLVALRDSKTGIVNTFTAAEWRDFIAGAKAGQFDI
ncbi:MULTISPECIES: DUF397 domain-containing protein [Thermomonospora]|mgnify:FL=1|uniref:DUF397 domain-containing protein n=1 Tax=Thermomonospora curvata (strain ATCC 19995 / DSM 43183 / JCM 3096 / KCTC 9072 / NBRC 15933 / NCIMB 10081 / Henssen B9) TaxID=471852 RepID=D1A2K3_THECD|nr:MULTISPECIES: DUF397 domain-containing protein [Thermomonospora]ACY96023.1 hypothetical protein Tcur_0425 [Thermomonospora curvata DSM 43183]PKK16006.1 MAG: DUF397 domain-containing protein [Thermomonospora sp. CIF 1]